MTVSPSSRILGLTLAGALSLVGCAPSEPASGPTPAVSSGGASTSIPPASSASAATSSGSPVDPHVTMAPGWEEGMPEVPVAAAVWEALMAPHGEYFAAAAYQAVLDEYGPVEPYASIREQELRHIAALQRQLQRLGVEVPDDPWPGIPQAPADLQTAAEDWAEGEVDNVARYDRLAAQAEGDAQVTRVFENLRRSSQESHLPLFREAAAHDGTTP